MEKKKTRKKNPTKRASPKKTSKKISAKEPTRIIIKYNTGINNNLYIRGSDAAGLSWDHGTLLCNVGPDEWVWETTLPFEDCEFKVLLNDMYYEDGENHHVGIGAHLQYSPHFS